MVQVIAFLAFGATVEYYFANFAGEMAHFFTDWANLEVYLKIVWCQIHRYLAPNIEDIVAGAMLEQALYYFNAS